MIQVQIKLKDLGLITAALRWHDEVVMLPVRPMVGDKINVGSPTYDFDVVGIELPIDGNLNAIVITHPIEELIA